MNTQFGTPLAFETALTRLQALLRWLGTELRTLLPAPLPNFVGKFFSQRFLIIDGNEWRLGFHQDSEDWVLLNMEDTDADRRERIARLDPGAAHQRVTTVIPVGDGFVRRVHLPAAAGERLHQVVSFQIDRLSPLRAQDVAFDCIKAAHEEDGTIAVLVGIVPKATLQSYEQRLQRMGLRAGQFALADTGLKFRPVDRSWTQQERLQASLGTAVCVMLAAAILLTPTLRESELTRLSAEISALKDPAAEAQTIRNSLLGMQSAIGAASEEASRPSALDTLRFLTALLPDTVQLTGLVIEPGSVRLIGSAPNAKNVVQLMNRSRKFKGAHLVDPIISQSPGKELFQIEADVMPERPR